jgi:hypothetical protein
MAQRDVADRDNLQSHCSIDNKGPVQLMVFAHPLAAWIVVIRDAFRSLRIDASLIVELLDLVMCRR